MARNETKYMESVVALSEELNFSRAAEKIRISQPMITKNLADVEAMLGFRLFERDRRSVQVNRAGKAYVQQARLALLYGERALNAARAVVQDADVILNVGRSPYTDPFLISTLLAVQLRKFPHFKIDLSSQYSYDLIHELLEGTLDLAIATEPPRSPALSTIQVAESPFYIAMREADELAAQSEVTLDQMKGRAWILFERRLHPPLYDSIMRVAEMRKVTPSRVQHIIAPEEAYPFVADGSAIAVVVKAGALRIARNGLTVRPLTENDLMLRTHLACRSDNQSKLLSEFVKAFVLAVGAKRAA